MRAKYATLAVLILAGLAQTGPAAAVTPPSNDNFTNAKTIVGFPVNLPNETNVGATEEPDEPLVDGFQYGASVWYRWKAPESRDYTVTLCGSASTFNSVLAVYTGSVLASLDWVEYNDYGCGAGSDLSRLSFMANRGVTYDIQVAGVDDLSGDGISQSTFDLVIKNGPGGLYLLDTKVSEGDSGRTSMTFTASLGTRKSHPVTVQWQTYECDLCSYIADPGSDYVDSHGVLKIPAGRRGGRFTVPVIGDVQPEDDEAFVAVLSNATGARIKHAGAVGIILNDD